MRLAQELFANFTNHIHHNNHFDLLDKLAVTLHYLTHATAIRDSAIMFGMSRSTADRYINEIISLVDRSLKKKIISLPDNNSEWKFLRNGMEQYGFPGAVLAIDGSLIKIERPGDFEGWYCRKGYPAVNVQIVCDFQKMIRSFSIRPGSLNDASIFRKSTFGINLDLLIPPRTHVLADSGYPLLPRLITPYEISNEMSRVQRRFNYIHSCTRNIVERCIGLLKSRFKILQLPLNQKTIGKSAQIIAVCMCFHNYFLLWNDQIEILPFDSSSDIANVVDDDPWNDTSREEAIRKRNMLAEFIAINRIIS
jgi:hypothetical protein